MNRPQIIAWTTDDAQVAVPVDLSVYSLDAVIKTAYRLTDRCFTLIRRDPDNSNQCVVFLIGKTPASNVQALSLELQNELVDQELRCQLEKQFKDVRTLIVAQAFSEGNLLDRDSDDGDYRTDSHGASKHR